eukprot:CAMPEP_0172582380 /NCGR_PEP_ID=MMETSP1068-20121228/1788_1 /TAXON_ID=35684 /ORGANISM="Pseudopedinella elastica, Strain CCMP716" /LENGTH=64 /DNA_ID=CAMNT_0013375707 /DNA_START=402 /DNA_END=593 /DNA_ORIENTATION=+
MLHIPPYPPTPAVLADFPSEFVLLGSQEVGAPYHVLHELVLRVPDAPPVRDVDAVHHLRVLPRA